MTALERRRAWTAGLSNAVVLACAGTAVVGSLILAVPAVGHHQLPGYLLAVLPLVTLGAFEMVSPVADAVATLSTQVPAADRLLALADLPDPVPDPVRPAPPPTSSHIALTDVVLRYGSGLPPALDGLSLSVPEGERVALVGPSGSGKTSVVNLLLRFWDSESGIAAIGGTAMHELSRDSVRKKIGWVAQDSHLFTTTIRANIVLARPGASDEEVAAAAHAAQLGTWIDSLPHGLDTPVGEQGAMVSGGQRQRLALARALLARPDVLVLDEPTSGLDHETASRLLEDVLDANPGRSLLYVTHRDEELAAFDRVVGIADGRAEPVGGPAPAALSPEAGPSR